MEIINQKFNDELELHIRGLLPEGHIYKFGKASEVLIGAGILDLPIELVASRLTDKSIQINHPYDISELKGLAKAIQNPLAVFRSASRIGSYVIMTKIEHKGKNYVAAVGVNRKQEHIKINSIRSIHYRNSNAHIANWINEGLLEYAHKQKMAEWFSKQQYNSADVRKLFNHAAKIVNDFENPVIREVNKSKTALNMTFREFKERVSILQVAEHLGYLPVRGKSSAARPVLRDAGGDTVLIKNPTTPGSQLFRNLNFNEQGSVIDFVKNRLNRFTVVSFSGEMDGINRVLEYFAGQKYDNAKFKSQTLSVRRDFNESDYKAIIPELKDLSFLTRERHLSPDTVNDFLPFIRIVQNDKYKNIGFPFAVPGKDNKVTGFEIRNFGRFKSFSAGGDKIYSAWVADFSFDRTGVSNVFFFESAIDAMSFYELHRNHFSRERSAFVSTGGFPALEQFNNVIKAYPNADLFACHDNDRNGHIFDIRLACVKQEVSCVINKMGDSLEFIVNDKRFTLSENELSLKNFFKKAEMNTSVKAMKPTHEKDWNDVLKKKNSLNPVKKPIFGRKK